MSSLLPCCPIVVGCRGLKLTVEYCPGYGTQCFQSIGIGPEAAATRPLFHDSNFYHSRNSVELFPTLTVLPRSWKTLLFSYQTSLSIPFAKFSALSRNLSSRSKVPIFYRPTGSDHHRTEQWNTGRHTLIHTTQSFGRPGIYRPAAW